MFRPGQRTVNGRVHFRWTSRPRGIFADHPIWQNVLFVSIFCALSGVAFMIKARDIEDETIGSLHYVLAAVLGIAFVLFVIGMVWAIDKFAGKVQSSVVIFDDEGVFGKC